MTGCRVCQRWSFVPRVFEDAVLVDGVPVLGSGEVRRGTNCILNLMLRRNGARLLRSGPAVGRRNDFAFACCHRGLGQRAEHALECWGWRSTPTKTPHRIVVCQFRLQSLPRSRVSSPPHAERCGTSVSVFGPLAHASGVRAINGLCSGCAVSNGLFRKNFETTLPPLQP